jgi:hypothetical protein
VFDLELREVVLFYEIEKLSEVVEIQIKSR